MNPYRQPQLKVPCDHPCNRSGCPEVLGTMMWFCAQDWNRVRSQTQQELNVAYHIANGEGNFQHPRYLEALRLARIEAEGGAERAAARAAMREEA
jgi:hypothetical protein